MRCVQDVRARELYNQQKMGHGRGGGDQLIEGSERRGGVGEGGRGNRNGEMTG